MLLIALNQSLNEPLTQCTRIQKKSSFLSNIPLLKLPPDGSGKESVHVYVTRRPSISVEREITGM